MKLETILSNQDFGQRQVGEICKSVLDGELDQIQNPIDRVIVNAWLDNNFDSGEGDKDAFITDLDYAISQLTKARDRMQRANH